MFVRITLTTIVLGVILLCACQTSMESEPSDSKANYSIPVIEHQLQFEAPQPDSPKVKGFQEVVFSVSNLEDAIAFYQEATGWELVYRGYAEATINELWQLSDSVVIEEALIRNPGNREGFLRLVKFHDTEQQPIRSSGRPWDIGGIFDINLRAVDLEASFREFQSNGWNGFSDPVRYQFGKFDVSEVVMQGPDAIGIAMMQRHAPPLEGYPHLRKLSHVFNSTHIARDIEVTADFFLHKLGFKTYLKVEGINRKAGRNVLGIPQNINAEIELPVYIVHPEGTNWGSVEFIQFKGLEGEDFTALAKPPNLGILMLRFPVSDAAAYARLLKQRGVTLQSELRTVEMTPYGKVKGFAIISPDGVWMEFLEAI